MLRALLPRWPHRCLSGDSSLLSRHAPEAILGVGATQPSLAHTPQLSCPALGEWLAAPLTSCSKLAYFCPSLTTFLLHSSVLV